MKNLRLFLALMVMCALFLSAESVFARGGKEKEEPAAAEVKVEAATGFDSYNLDSRKITIEKFNEAPMLAELVAAGKLPPVEERLPDNPLVMEPWEEVGRYGGQLEVTSLEVSWDPIIRHAANADLIEYLPAPGVHHANLVGFETRPGVFEDWSVSADGKNWTFWIRKGLKWSDGTPVTTEDVRFTFEDIYLNEEVTPVFPVWLKRGGEPAEYERIDDRGFRLNFAEPYGLLEVLLHTHGRGGLASMIKPSDYLKQFHKKYTDMDKILPIMKEKGLADEEWGRFMASTTNSGWGGTYMMNVMEPIEYPVVNPWRVVDNSNPGEFIFERNPYYFKVDTAGNQLPYIDRIREVAAEDPEIITMKLLTGDMHIEGGYFAKLSDYPMFIENKEKGGYDVLLTKDWLDHPLIFFLNYAPADLVLREIVQDPRFAQALSLALDREDFIESLFLGFGRPAQVSPIRGSAIYDEKLERSYADYDPDRANALLDEMGLKWDENQKYRLRPDGKRLTLTLSYYEVFPSCTPGSELASEYWKAIGVHTPLKLVDGSTWWTMFQANETVLTTWGLGSASVVPQWFFQGFSTTTSQWWQWYQTGGKEGIEPTPAGKEVYRLRDIIQSTPSDEERLDASRKLFEIQAEHLWVIGVAVDVPSPLVYSSKLGNIAVAKDFYNISVLDAGEQWFFKE